MLYGLDLHNFELSEDFEAASFGRFPYFRRCARLLSMGCTQKRRFPPSVWCITAWSSLLHPGTKHATDCCMTAAQSCIDYCVELMISFSSLVSRLCTANINIIAVHMLSPVSVRAAYSMGAVEPACCKVSCMLLCAGSVCGDGQCLPHRCAPAQAL